MDTARIFAPTPSASDFDPGAFRAYNKRWAILAMFSTMTCFSNVICFTFASVSHSTKQFLQTGTLYTNAMVQIYFFSYIPLSFLGTYVFVKRGLRFGVLLGGTLQAIGAWVRVVGCYHGGFPVVFLGQAIASVGQPFFVNSPPLVAANWFGDHERTIATTIGVDANVLGVALAFIIGPNVVSDASGIPRLCLVIAVATTVFALTAVLFFESTPPTPPSLAAVVKEASGEAHEMRWSECITVFRNRGFGLTVMGFAIAETVLNMIPIFLNQILLPEGFSRHFVGWLGALFIIAGVVGSVLISYVVDGNRRYKGTLVGCFGTSALAMACFTVCVDLGNAVPVVFSVAAVGFCIGAVEPVGTELGVECAYPTPEATVAGVQQLMGQVGSLLFVPLLNRLEDPVTHDMDNANWFLTATLAFATVAFLFFDGETKRLAHEKQVLIAVRAGSVDYGGVGSLRGGRAWPGPSEPSPPPGDP
eukprot:tig00000241_g20881.t1